MLTIWAVTTTGYLAIHEGWANVHYLNILIIVSIIIIAVILILKLWCWFSIGLQRLLHGLNSWKSLTVVTLGSFQQHYFYRSQFLMHNLRITANHAAAYNSKSLRSHLLIFLRFHILIGTVITFISGLSILYWNNLRQSSKKYVKPFWWRIGKKHM